MRERLIGLGRLVRPLNVVLFFAGVALGGVLAAGPAAFEGSAPARLALAMASAACIGAAANAINYVYDVAIDRVNRPGRPVPSGQVTVRAAVALWAALSALGVGLGLALSLRHGAVAAASVALLWAYSARLKRTPGPGHLAVAAVLGLALLYGAWAVRDGAGAAWLGVAFAILTTLAREGAKAVEDVAGDAADGARTLPVVWGVRPTLAAVLAVTALTLAALPAPALLGLGSPFLAFALPAAAALLAAAWHLLVALRPPGAAGPAADRIGTDPPATGPASEAVVPAGQPEAVVAAAGRASAALKAAMAAGVLALALARLA